MPNDFGGMIFVKETGTLCANAAADMGWKTLPKDTKGIQRSNKFHKLQALVCRFGHDCVEFLDCIKIGAT